MGHLTLHSWFVATLLSSRLCALAVAPSPGYVGLLVWQPIQSQSQFGSGYCRQSNLELKDLSSFLALGGARGPDSGLCQRLR